MKINLIGIWTVYLKEMTRTSRVIGQTIISPVITTTLYFVVFGAAVGSNIDELQGVSYGAFIMPGLIMLSLTTNALTASSSGIYFPKWTGVIYEMLTAPLSYFEICLGYVLAASTRAFIIAIIIFLVSLFHVDFSIKYPLYCLFFAFITTLSFALFGFVMGLAANSFEQLTLMPNFIITPLSFLGGIFYNLEMLPPFWRNISVFNPFVYMNNGLRYGFYGITDVDPVLCVVVILIFSAINLGITLWIFRTGFRLRQ
jgi:ABC-2 type transport system permease protein